MNNISRLSFNPWIISILFFITVWGIFEAGVLKNEFIESARSIIITGQRLLHIVIALVTLSLFINNLKTTHILIAGLIGVLANDFEFINTYFLDFIASLELVEHSILRNRQWGKIILFSTIIVLYLIKMTRKKYRKQEQWFILTIALAVCTTAALFHATIVQQGYQDIKDLTGTYMEQAAGLNNESFEELCYANEWHCQSWKTNEKPPIKLNPVFIEALEKSAQFNIWKNTRIKQLNFAEFVDNSQFAVFHFRKLPTEYRAIVEAKKFTENTIRFQLSFYILQMMATTTWLIGGLVVLFTHKNRQANKLIKKRELQENHHTFVTKQMRNIIGLSLLIIWATINWYEVDNFIIGTDDSPISIFGMTFNS